MVSNMKKLSLDTWIAIACIAFVAPVIAQEKSRCQNLSDSANQEFLQRLRSTDSHTRIAALKDLQRLETAPVFAQPTLISLLQQPPSRETVQVMRLLRRIGPDAAEAVPRLHEILKFTAQAPETRDDVPILESPDPWQLVADLRTAAGLAMAEMGKPGETAIPTLIEMLKDPGPSLRSYRKPRKLAAPSAEGYAAMLYRQDNHGVYVDHRDMLLAGTLSGLAAFGQRAKSAEPAIAAIRDDPETLPQVAHLAKETLRAVVASESRQRSTARSDDPD